MEDVRLLRSGVLSAEAVAESGYKGVMSGRRVVVPGLANKLGVFLTRILPRRAVVRYAHAMLRRTG